MNGWEWMGKLMVFFGLGIAAIGGLIWLMARWPGVGELPGTLRIERPGFTCVIPILGSILLSILLTIVLNIVARLLK
ncbi:MAG: DUF2905 domain-containing protein [Anaerolineae bacterium]|nr:DUF2905 domain-containing protein [Anaerolineae bacterium]